MNMDEVNEKGYQNVMLVTDKGRQMKVDLVIPCTGLKVNTEAYRKSLGQSYFIGEYWWTDNVRNWLKKELMYM